MPFSESITIDRTGTGGDIDSNNPPLATLDEIRVPIVWGDTNYAIAQAGSGADVKVLNTTYKITCPTNIEALFLPNGLINATTVHIRFKPQIFKNGDTVLIEARNIGPASKSVIASETLGHLYFIESKPILTLV